MNRIRKWYAKFKKWTTHDDRITFLKCRAALSAGYVTTLRDLQLEWLLNNEAERARALQPLVEFHVRRKRRIDNAINRIWTKQDDL